MSARYVLNDTVRVSTTFTVDDVLTDPAVISLTVTDPTGTANTYTYAASQIIKSGTGSFYKDIAATVTGVWSFVWTGAGAAAGVEDGTFTVYDDAPTTDIYCQVDELRGEKGIPDNADDVTLLVACKAASRQIDRFTGRRFWQDPTATARTFFLDDLAYLPDIATTTGLLVNLDLADTGTYGTALTVNTDFLLRPTNAALLNPAEPYTELAFTGQNYWPIRSAYGRPTVQITARWGWPAVPDDIKKACLIQAQQLSQAKDAAFGVAALAMGDGTGMRASSWNPIALELVRPYQIPAVG